MNRNEALKKSDEALQELAAALASGKSEMLIKYLEMVSRFHQYSFSNCMLIYLQLPNATFVAGFQQWRKLGRWVRRGEKGIVILAPVLTRKDRPKVDGDQSSPEVSSGQRRILCGFRTAYVFDVSQTEGEELAEFAKLNGDPGRMSEKLESFILSKSIEIEYANDLGGANGVSIGGKIRILSSLEPAQRFSTMVHELAHELLHRDNRRSETTKAIRETEAEAVAFVVCRSIGLECSSRASDYIQLHCGDVELLSRSLDFIRRVAAEIIAALNCPEQTQPPLELASTASFH